MIYHWIHDAYGIAGLLGLTLTFGLVLYAVLAGGSYAAIFFLWRRRFVPDYRPDPEDIRKSLLLTAYAIAGNAVLLLPVQLLIVFGNSRVYYDVDSYGWSYLVVSLVGILLFGETVVYWTHRALHTRWLYRVMHIQHHKFREPTPLSSLAFHPVDSFLQGAPYHLFALLVPINFYLYLSLVVFLSFWGVMVHDRVRLVPGKIINHTGCHTAHHWYQKYNYGQYFTFWDRLCGTYRDPEDLPDRFMASKVPAYRLKRPAPAPAPE